MPPDASCAADGPPDVALDPARSDGTVVTSRPARPSVVRPTARGRLKPSRAVPKAATNRRQPVGRRRAASAGVRTKSRGRAGVGIARAAAPRATRSACSWAHRLQPATRASAAARSVAVSERSVSAATRIGSCVAWAAVVRGSVISLVRRDVVATGSPGCPTGGPRRPRVSRKSRVRGTIGSARAARGERSEVVVERGARRAGRDDRPRRSRAPPDRARDRGARRSARGRDPRADRRRQPRNSSIRSSSRSRRASRPRWIRDFTVPSDTPVMSAISA